ncbi:hypothetical protein LA345_38800 (plasmid) [Burkholderia vietnamiensis]|uniref:Uncharacterized protein n=1 Tax=Burkholderia vietnamiensis (strain G4 / LMG 22486) TaxID=269482 RepID=A4JWC2_BURVG|nr:hypothetical protein Bcep1808_7705 [Burkholderia vietnamiensis G4]MCB4349748.1 hypothetical protein [Burkholderia vietnamiensis]
MDDNRERLLRERIAKLESTLTFYDRRFNTNAADEERKRLAALESALDDVLCSHPTDDPAMILVKAGLSPERGAEILILLNKKFAT